MEREGSSTKVTRLAAALVMWVAAAPVSAELFVADFNGDGKPDVLMSSPSAPDGFVVLLNQGEWGGKIQFQKVMPDVKTAGMSMERAAPAPASPSGWAPTAPAASWPAATTPSASWPGQTPAAPATPKPAITPPPAPSISSSAPRLKPLGGSTSAPAPARATPAAAPRSDKPMAAEPAKPDWKPAAPEAQPAKSWSAGGRKVALFNYKDKTAGAQFAWLERGIANILKFDIIEVKSVQMLDRDRTDVTFDPAWFKDSGLAADLIITGEFQEAGERLIVTTWFLSPSMSALREFKVEGDRADIFSLIEKVGSQLKQELSSL